MKDKKIKEIRHRECPELRMEEESKSLVGYAAVFNSETVIGGEFREMIAPGAFSKTIDESDIRFLWNHNSDIVLGRNRAKTLTLVEDETGLKINCQPSENSTIAQDCVDTINRGDVNQMSFGFYPIKEEWQEPEERSDKPLRIIREAVLFDVSAVTYPAYEDSSIQLRTAMENSGRKQEGFEYINKEEEILDDSKKSEQREESLHAEDCECCSDGKPVTADNHSPLKLRQRQLKQKIMEINNEY